jgi:plastocyanin
MRGTRPVLVGVLALATLALAGCGGGGSSSSSSSSTSTTSSSTTSASGMTLDGVVGPGFTITLTQNGQPVSTLTPGTYTINVDDKSDIHNFHLMGPGVDKATDVSATGTQTWTVTLKDGTYKFQCDPHASTMNGSFTVSG